MAATSSSRPAGRTELVRRPNPRTRKAAQATTGARQWHATAPQLEAIFSAIPNGVTIQEPGGRLLFANTAAARIIGFQTVEELLSTPVEHILRRFELLAPDGTKLDYGLLPGRRALQGEYPGEELLRFRLVSTGAERWSRVSALPVQDEEGNVLYAVNFFHDVTELQRRERAVAFMAKATSVLASSLDYETTLKTVSDLVVPDLADWCVVHVREEDGTIRQLSLSHADPAKIEWAKEVARQYPSDYTSDRGLGKALKDGKSQLISEIPDAMLVAAAKDARHLELLRNLGMHAVMIVPLIARGRTLGAISYITGGRYDGTDLALAEELARHAAMAVDNARLYRHAQAELEVRRKAEEELRRSQEELQRMAEGLEERVQRRTRQLEEARMRDRINLQRLKDMLRSMPMAAVATDEHLTVLHANDRFGKLFGMEDGSQVVGKDSQMLLSLSRRIFLQPDAQVHTIQDIIARHAPAGNVELPLADGRTLSWDCIPLYEGGEYRGHLLLFRDITREKRVDRAKSEFMSLASHQLRTPLTVIRWALSRLQKRLPDDARLQSITVAAKSAAETMSETINAMLAISRIEAERVERKDEDVYLDTCCAELQQDCREEAERKGVLLRFDCTPDIVLRTDRLLLREILLSLLRNAIKYTDAGGKVRFRTYLCDDGVRISVSDTGIGIPLREQHKMFRKFFRAENAVSRDPNGTGLGLYLSHLTAKLLEAELSFVSEEGKGTTFTLLFPTPRHGNNPSR